MSGRRYDSMDDFFEDLQKIGKPDAQKIKARDDDWAHFTSKSWTFEEATIERNSILRALKFAEEKKQSLSTSTPSVKAPSGKLSLFGTLGALASGAVSMGMELELEHMRRKVDFLNLKIKSLSTPPKVDRLAQALEDAKTRVSDLAELRDLERYINKKYAEEMKDNVFADDVKAMLDVTRRQILGG